MFGDTAADKLAGYGISDDITLLDALELGVTPRVGGGANALLRHAVAALLNALHPEVTYPEADVDIIEDTTKALCGDLDIDELKPTLKD